VVLNTFFRATRLRCILTKIEWIILDHKENVIMVDLFFKSINISFDLWGSTSGNVEQFRGMGVQWICFRLAFPPRGISDSKSVRKRERMWWGERKGEGVGININIIALIALDRGDARAYDTLQITRRGSAAKRTTERVNAWEEEEYREREKRAAGWLCR